jgi:propionyl-CoA carboxylase alpha chain
VLADRFGNTVYLFERECSIQRRHQKVVEEAPSAILTPELRRKMGEAAVNVCRACGYENAGTVEFIVDAERNFYFLEMNTRLQVEHPVTEMITGLDLVREQIRIAQGEPLGYSQDDLRIHGHAIQVRVYAEDPRNNFLPDIGRLVEYAPPSGTGIRVDDGFEQGMDIPIFYDPMIAKLIVHAPSRQEAIARMREAIRHYRVVGIETTLGFGRFVMNHPAFQAGDFTTGFVAKHFRPELLDEPLTNEEATAAALVAAYFATKHPSNSLPKLVGQPVRSAWSLARG